VRCHGILLAVVLLVAVFPGRAMAAQDQRPSQPPPVSEKDARTPAQQKIDSQVLYEIYRRRGEAVKKGVPLGSTGVKIDTKGRALVDVRVDVTPAIEGAIRSAGGTIVSASAAHHSVVAWVPLLKLESLAGNPAVRAIEPVAEAVTNPKAPS
jgi:hypothetical protein